MRAGCHIPGGERFTKEHRVVFDQPSQQRDREVEGDSNVPNRALSAGTRALTSDGGGATEEPRP